MGSGVLHQDTNVDTCDCLRNKVNGWTVETWHRHKEEVVICSGRGSDLGFDYHRTVALTFSFSLLYIYEWHKKDLAYALLYPTWLAGTSNLSVWHADWPCLQCHCDKCMHTVHSRDWMTTADEDWEDISHRFRMTLRVTSLCVPLLLWRCFCTALSTLDCLSWLSPARQIFKGYFHPLIWILKSKFHSQK